MNKDAGLACRRRQTPGHKHVEDSARDPDLVRTGSAPGFVSGGDECLAVR